MSNIDRSDEKLLLAEYFSEANEDRAEAILSSIMGDHAAPAVNTFFHSRLNSKSAESTSRYTQFDAEDLASTAMVELLVGFRRHREVSTNGIENLDSYVRSICRSTYSNYFRKHFTEYYRLKNRVRYLLMRPDAGFIVEHDANGILRCALNERSARVSNVAPKLIVEGIMENFPNYPVMSELELVNAAFDQTKGWIHMSGLVMILAKIRGIDDIPPFENPYEDGYLEFIAGNRDLEGKRREFVIELESLWHTIRQLPRLQKLALLYHLRDFDGREVNTVWFESGLATLAEIAEQFEVPEAQMARLLVRLPFSDMQIAQALGFSERSYGRAATAAGKRISNLRSVARASLQRRLDGKQQRKRKENLSFGDERHHPTGKRKK
jgi:hypothetical protein